MMNSTTSLSRMISTDAKSWPPRQLVKVSYRLWHRLRQWLIKDVEIIDGEDRYRFRCETLLELTRCMSLFSKEAGTCKWIKEEVKPGNVFYDIGANIGIYSILAARMTGPSGRVFAFEPHSVNFTRLLENIVANESLDVIVPCNFALHDQEGFFPFNYLSSEAGSANSQLSTLRSVHEVDYEPKVSELKYASSIDNLLASRKFMAPHHVKIDVDGNEFLILKGMHKLLNSTARPRTVQVEINKRYKNDIMLFMEAHNYVLSHKHYTASGLKYIMQGADPEEYSYNAIFRAYA